MSKKMTLENARERQALKLRASAANLPLRMRPVIVLAEDEIHYRVTDLGTATAHDLQIVR